MLDPVARAIASALTDDEPVTEEERQAVARSEAWFEERAGMGIPMEEVLADFGLTTEGLARKDGPQPRKNLRGRARSRELVAQLGDSRAN